MANTSLYKRLDISAEQSDKVGEKPGSKWTGIVLMLCSLLLLVGAGMLQTGVFSLRPAMKTANLNTNILPPPRLPSGKGVPATLNMGMPDGTTSITSLHAPLTAPEVKQFTLVAQNAMLTLAPGLQTPAWSFNGTVPGPTLRVKQGDLVVVHVVNHLAFGITIHWHGIDVPNSQDGVAGVTQDAIQPDQTFTYRFVVNEPGTYWYHSHQQSEAETDGGLFGALIVEPEEQTAHADVDYTVALHEWNLAGGQTIFTMNDTAKTLSEAAQPGQWVRLRIIESSSTATTAPHLLTLVGAPFKVIALDGHDLNDPQWLNETPLPIGSAQRYDVLFQMPAHGSVSLVAADETNMKQYLPAPAVVIGQGGLPATLPTVNRWFDLTTYGKPLADASGAITLQSHFDVTANLVLSNQMGTSLGRMGMTYSINGKIFPDTGMIMVKEGQLVRIHFDNQSDLYHPMHLHGHVFTVLLHNGKPLTGSSVHLDTVLIPPHSTYDIAFVANNPGLWMMHCHNLLHANWGMDMMIAYDGYTTPYTVGTTSKNFPD